MRPPDQHPSLSASRLASSPSGAPGRPESPATEKRNPATAIRILLLVLGAAVISLLHYSTPTDKPMLHVIFQRCYYLPIIFASFWFPPRGGIAMAALTSAQYLPHVFLHWRHEVTYQMAQLTEVLMFFVIGAVAGILSEREKRQKQRYFTTAAELESAYDELRGTLDQLRLTDRLASLGTMSAGMAHEIKNPLASISGSLEILETELGGKAREHEFFQILRKEIHRLTGIVDRYLEFARPHPPQRVETDFNDLVRTVIQLTRKQAASQGITIEEDFGRSLPRLIVDGEQIRQVILNLVLNAVQATPSSGPVSVVTRIDSGEAICSIRDCGPGLPAADPHRIFDPFFTTKPGGTGLGLPVAYRLVEQHGGKIVAANHPDGGAVFTVHLPLRNREKEHG